MLTLYHGDTAVCAAKVRLTLAEKALPWEGVSLDLGRGDQFAADYLRLNPEGVVPTLVEDGRVVTESTVINEYLEDRFPDPPLRPADALGRARLRGWTKREDAIHAAVNTLTTLIVFRPDLLRRSEAERAARIDGMPDPSRRAKFRALLDQGAEAAVVEEALIRFARQFRDMQAALTEGGPWLLGESFSLADGGLISFLYRLEILQLGGFWAEPFPAVADWLARCKARPSFREAIGRFLPEAALAKYRADGQAALPVLAGRYARALAAI